MSEPRASRARRRVSHLALALGLTSCVVHTPGLEVEVALHLDVPPELREARVTLVELVACPGAEAAHHHHHDDASAPWSLPLSDEPETVLLTPVPGRYCDLRVQLEADEVAPRQAVRPLRCGDARQELTLSAASLARGPILLEVSGTSPSPPDAPMQRQLDQMLGTLVVDACVP